MHLDFSCNGQLISRLQIYGILTGILLRKFKHRYIDIMHIMYLHIAPQNDCCNVVE